MGHKRAKPATGGGTAVRVLLRTALGVGVVAAVVGTVSWLGREAGGRVADQPRYHVAVADIRCDPPPGVERAAFLSEVRHLGGLPATVSGVDPATPKRLADAFARHPWVEAVSGVTVGEDRSVSAKLQYRVPTLAVRLTGSLDEAVVDRGGMVLPAAADGLPVLTPALAGPPPKPGERWPGETVVRAAELADQHRGRKLVRVERSAAGWRLVPSVGPALVVRF